VSARFLEVFSSSLGASLPGKPWLEVALHLREGIELRNASVDPSRETWVIWGFLFSPCLVLLGQAVSLKRGF
jgi:hypothetical protein